MNDYVVAITIDKVQSFLYRSIYANTQEQQMNTGTLKGVISSSRLISNDLYDYIGMGNKETGLFYGHIQKMILYCSGMCIFVTDLNQDQILNRLQELFRDYYFKCNGQLLVKYHYFPYENSCDPLDIIKISKNALKRSSCFNKIIALHKDELFQFQKVKEDKATDTFTTDDIASCFTDTINDLQVKNEDKDKNDSRFRIAVIKADFDGMGQLFQNLKTYSEYKDVSKLLSEMISLKSLSKQVKYQRKYNPDFKCFPLYAAGDDLFFAVPALQLLQGVWICKYILNTINRKLPDKVPKLSLSVGIEFTFNREPIRYYYERVEKQLAVAKKVKALPNNMKICINENVFFFGDDYHKNKDIDNWDFFINDVKMIQAALTLEFPVHHLFYGLLEKIQDAGINKDEISYSNAVLYHIIPKHTWDIAELVLLYILIRPLYKKIENEDEYSLCFDYEHKKRLKAHIQLLLLFSDKRFYHVKTVEEDLEKTKQKAKHEIENKFEKLNINPYFLKMKNALFTAPLQYIYKHNLMPDTLGVFFILLHNREFKNRKGNTFEVPEYHTLRISNSLFHRMKNLPIHDTALLIEVENPVKQIEAENSVNQIEEKKKGKLIFKKQDFINYCNDNPDIFNSTYIDALLIFYTLNQLSIQYKVKFKFKKNQKHNQSTRGKSNGKAKPKNHN